MLALIFDKGLTGNMDNHRKMTGKLVFAHDYSGSIKVHRGRWC